MDEFKFEIDRDGSFEPDEEWLLFNNARLSTRGTPDIISGVGIAINAPREVQFSEGPRLSPKDAQFIVCVATQFVYDMMGYGSDFMDKLTIVVVDARTHQEYAASALGAEDSNIGETLVPFPSDMPSSKTDHTNTTIGEVLRANLAKMLDLRVASLVRGYFRIELVDPDDVVPEGPFWLTISLGEHLSNIVAFAGPPAPAASSERRS